LKKGCRHVDGALSLEEIVLNTPRDEPWVQLSKQIEDLRSEIANVHARLDSIDDSRNTWIRKELETNVERGGLSAEGQAALRRELNIVSSEATSIAIVDWTSIRNSCLLLEGVDPKEFQTLALDPFIALADLASIVGAVIFYDRVLVLADVEWAWRANRFLGLQDEAPIVPVDVNGSIQSLVIDHWSKALNLLDSAQEEQSMWLGWLAEAWSRLLPDVTYPSHRAVSYQDELGLYDDEYMESGSPERETLLQVFSRTKDTWHISEENLPRIILDNDVRALFYDNLSVSLSRAFSDDQHGPSVSYVGGCLRSPMLLARAKYAEASFNDSTQVQNWLQSQWRLVYHPTSASLRMPFWMDAILAVAHDRSGISAAIQETRRSAKSLRKTRSRLDEALRAGDSKTINQLMSALKGDLVKATEPLGKVAGAAGLAGQIIGQSVLPVVPADVTGRVVEASIGSSQLRKFALRLFRPHLRFVLSITSQAAEREKSIAQAARIFGWPSAFAAEPLAFLERLTEVAWIA
jgi:hypothetical protein